MKVPFNTPLIIGNEYKELNKAFTNDRFSGNGNLTQECNLLLESRIGCKKSIMTSSCTDALEMASLLSYIEPDDEVIMPSYTFVSTASAFELRKAKIVWCDIREDTKNIDENKIEKLITSKTKAIVVVHYAGVSCEMNKIKELCDNYKLFLIEDAAQAIDCYFENKPLGSIGDLATLSFHETKNIHCGEGGALLVNNPSMVDRAQFIRDKGTNRIHFNEGKVDKYTWVELGSSYLMSELQAGFLLAQLKQSKEVNKNRLSIWQTYYELLSKFINKNQLPFVPDNCHHNAHMFYILCKDIKQRKKLINFLKEKNISAIFHYVPLHKAPYWKGKYDHIHLPVTDKISETLLRLPLYYGMQKEEIEYVVKSIKEFYTKEGLNE